MAGGKWRAEVQRQGKRRSRVFATKQAARDWAASEEYAILNAKKIASGMLFGDAMNRYAREVSPRKGGARWEILRLERFRRDDIAAKRMADLESSDFATWRDKRLREVAPGTVNREMTLLSGVLSVARKEWGLIDKNPLSDVRKPTKPPPRDRIPTQAEMDRLALSAGSDLTRATARAFHAFLFAIETAMRAGEITGLTWDRIDLDARVAHLPKTKNGYPRDVPLSSEAVRLLEVLPRQDPVFGLSSASLSALWRKLRDRAAVVDLTYHDSRHIAISRLAGKLEVLELARMVGHRNLNELLTYFQADAKSLAKKLD